MTIQEFVNTHKGRINLSILPNGISQSKQGSINCCFSLLIGLNIDDISYDYFDISNPEQLLQEIGATLNNTANQIKLKIENSVDCNPLTNVVLFNAKHKRRWNRLLSKNSFYIRNQAKPLPGQTESFASKIGKSISNSTPLFSESLLNELENEKSLVATIDNAINVAEYQNNVDLKILQREKIFDNTIYQGQTNSLEYYEVTTKNIKTKKDKKDLLLLINSIYQHPTMARHYGLIFDFEIPKVEQNGDFVFEYFKNNSEKAVDLEFAGTNSSYFQESKCFSNTNLDIKNIVKLFTYKSPDGKKYYHGLTNFGCLLNTSFQYAFSTVSPDHKIQNEKLIADSKSQNFKEGKKLMEFSDIKRKVTEGVYLYQKPQSNSLKNLSSLDSCEIGILGQNIAVQVTNEKESNLHSLCKREAVYNPIGLGCNISTIEEGWLHTNIAIEGIGQSLNPQTIFHWTGQNLCVPRLGAHKDQKLNPDELKQAGGIVGIFENKENEIIEKVGYQFSYELVEGADIQLIENKGYKFLIRQVASNGYLLPLKSKHAFDFSLEDLIAAFQSEYFFEFGDFSLDEDPINPPALVANKVFEEKGDKTTESSNHMVVYQDNDTNSRLVFPPIIDLQFSHYLGLLSKETLGASTKHEYLKKCKQLVFRAKNKIPSSTSNSSVSYLPDIRGKRLVVTPANWFTRWFLKNEVKSLEIFKNNFFDYSNIDNNFNNLEAGLIKLSAESTFHWEVNTDNVLKINVIEGIQLKFYIQTQEDIIKATNFANSQAFSAFKTKNKKRLLISMNNQPQYVKGEFQVTRAKAKPDKPEIVKEAITVLRPTKSTDLNKVFYSFKLSNKSSYLQTVKQLQIISSYIDLNDGKDASPTKLQISEGVEKWETKNSARNFELLNNELPLEVFERTIKQVETEVYKNNFGFNIQLDTNFLNDLILNSGDEIVHLNAGNNLDIYLKFDTGTVCDLFLNSLLVPEIGKIDLSFGYKIILTWNLINKPNSELELTIRAIPRTGAESSKTTTGKIPYSDVSERNLSLFPKIEQKLLLVEDANNSNQIFNFEHVNSEHKYDFFVYRSEAKQSLIRKEIMVQAVSRFQEFYPTLKKEQFYSVLSDKINLLIKNNDKPALPIFKITPLIFHTNEIVEKVGTRKRSMQIMFEIDRPLQNEETFALIISDNNTISPMTCAIGRDLTTFNATDFADGANPNGFTIDNFLFQAAEPKYLPKYWNKISAADTLVTKEIQLNGTQYKILPLIPYFESKKNKWIAVLALDQDKLQANNLNAYNPFLKIVMVRYSENSTTGNFSSELTLPKYINLISERFIEVSFLSHKQDFWKIEIKNIQQVKLDNSSNRRSHFVVCLREQSHYGINGQIVESISDSGTALEFHIIQNNTINIQIQRRKILCVYEFETFDNSQIDLTKIDWLHENKVRLVYAENF
jgi:hypothetical protein